MTAFVLLILLIVGLTALSIAAAESTSGRPPRGRPPLSQPNSASGTSYAPVIFTAQYRTKDGTRDYSFRFEQAQNSGFRIYVLAGYEPLSPPHLIGGSDGPYICWTNSIHTYEDAKAISGKWAEAVENFRKTGRSF